MGTGCLLVVLGFDGVVLLDLLGMIVMGSNVMGL